MNTHTAFDTETTQALLSVCFFAALADGNIDDSEREGVRKLAEELGSDSADALMREILMGKRSWETVVAALKDGKARLLAYEMARSICEADGGSAAEEIQFLEELKSRLGIDKSKESIDTETKILEAEVAQQLMAKPAFSSNDDMIMRAAIINGALEILPSTLATMGILPLQMKLVYGVAKSHGVELGSANIKDFLATLGAGLSSQLVEGFARKLLGGIGKTFGGKLIGGLASQVTGSAMSFASTYAIGHVADRYYAGGQKLSMVEIKSLMSELTQRAKDIYSTKLPEIQESAKKLNTSALFDLVKGKTPVI